MYQYSSNNAETYSKLGIKGTTYESGFEETKRILGDLKGKTALDFGCGAGRTAKLLLSLGAGEVIGVDHNQSMIDQATRSQIERSTFHKIDKKIPLEDNSIDVSLAAHVFVEVASIEEMKQISSEVFRVLKKGGRFIIITNNSKAIGCEYLSFGYPKNDHLKSGEKIPCTIKKGKESFVIDDYFWYEEDYKKTLKEVGFSISMTFPKSSGEGWLEENRVASHVVICATK